MVPDNRRRLVIVALLVASAGLVYLPTLRYDFVWDDQMLITENRNLRTTNPTALFGQAFWPDSRSEGYYRPFVALTYWVERRVWGSNPLGFHLTNVLLNCLVAGLVALVLARLLGVGNGSALLAGGLLFALHPAHVESVAFISGRTDLLMSAFLLVAMLLVIRFRDAPGPGTGAAAVASFALALLCKEAAIVFPLLVFMLLASLRKPGTARSAWLFLLSIALVAAVYLAFRSLVLAGRTASWAQETAGQRILLVVNGFGRYLAQAFWPFNHRLLSSNVERFAAPGWASLVGAVGLAGLVWSAFRFRFRPLGLGSAWFVLFLLPGCNLFPIGLTYFAERILYLPLFGLIIAGLDGFRMLSLGSVPGKAALIAALVWAALLGAGTLRRLPIWQSNATLYAAMVREAPDSPNAHYNLGTELDKQGDISGAMAAYEKALEVAPDFAQAYNNLGVLLERTGDRAGAFLAYARAMALDSSYATVRYNYAGALKGSGDISGAIRECRRALEFDPYLTPARRNLARLYLEVGDTTAALDEYQAGLELEPDDAELHYGLAGVLRASGNLAEAIAE